MSDRDAARDLARQSKLDSDWIQYKNLRNRCTRLQAIDKKKGMSNPPIISLLKTMILEVYSGKPTKC